MEKSWYSFDVSPIWAMAAFVAAILISFLLYSKKGIPWNRNVNILLGVLRFGAVFLILLLILNPLLKLSQNETEKPVLVYAIDNSESISLRSTDDELDVVRSWVNKSSDNFSEEYDVEKFYLSDSEDSISFTSQTTNLSALMNRIENVYEGRNLSGVILLSDGIPNQGQSPDFRQYTFPVFTIGLGDTIPPKDISISHVISNKVAYQGNQFPVRVSIYQKGYSNELIEVYIKEGSRILASESVTLSQANTTTNFILDAKNPGLKRLTVSTKVLEGESSEDNNEQDLYIDVIEGKENILILAPAPHPDINAIRSVLAEAENYSTYVYIPGVSKEKPSIKNFDVIIEHEAFTNRQYGDYGSNGKWMIIGGDINNSNRGQLYRESFIKIQQNGRQTDQVRPAYNSSFSKFILSNDLSSRPNNYPPINVPFGDYSISGPVEVLFYQKVGNITTDRPLMSFFDNGSIKQAISVGTGFWQWKLQESASEGNADFYKEFVLKTIQYLSIKAQKDRFVARPRQNEYNTNDRIYIDTEVYNEIYERTYGNTISMIVTNEDGVEESYELIDSPSNSSINLGSKSPGIYQFKAQVTDGGKTFVESGAFAVKEIQLEGLSLAANHNLLRTISKNSGGKFYTQNQLEQLSATISSMNSKPMIHTSERFIPLINSLWIILLITGLLTTEWFFRKFLGAY